MTAYDPDLYAYDEDGNPEPHGGLPKEEPECGFCNDSGCAECDPSPEAYAARDAAYHRRLAEFEAAVARGEAQYDTEAPF